jgi:hypothetical protein
MKTTSLVVLASLFVIAGTASAQDADSGVVMSHDPARVAQFEQHARDVQAQPATMQFAEGSDTVAAHDAAGDVHHSSAAKHAKPKKKHAHKVDAGK